MREDATWRALALPAGLLAATLVEARVSFALALADEKVHLLDILGRADPVIIAGEDFNLRRQWAALITGDSLGLGVIEVEIT